MGFPRLEELVPHRGPALLLDRVVAFADEQVRCLATFGATSQYAEPAGVEAVIGIELIAQAAAVYTSLEARAGGSASEPEVGYIVGIPEAEFPVARLPLDVALEVSGRMVWREGAAARFAGEVRAGEVVLVRAEVNVVTRRDG